MRVAMAVAVALAMPGVRVDAQVVYPAPARQIAAAVSPLPEPMQKGALSQVARAVHGARARAPRDEEVEGSHRQRANE